MPQLLSIREAYQLRTNGDFSNFVRTQFLGKNLQLSHQQLLENDHLRRRAAIRERLRWYRDGQIEDINALVDLVFANKKVRDQRKKFAEMSLALNVSRRVVDERSNLYDRAPERRIRAAVGKGFDEKAEEYLHLVEDELELDETYQEAQRLTNLCSATLLWLARSVIDGQALTLRVIAPDGFDPIPHVDDSLMPMGYVIDAAPHEASFLAPIARDRQIHYEVWDALEVTRLDRNGEWVSTEVHNLGRIPGVLATATKPVDKLIEWTRGADLLAAHKAVVLLNLLILRLAKSQGENQPVMTGPLAKVAAGQPMDGETPTALPPDVTIEMLQTKTDPSHYLQGIKHFIGGVAQTYGMSYEQFTFQETSDTTSGRAYSVRRQKLSEMRVQQARRWRRYEAQVAFLIGIDPTRFALDYHDPALPTDPMEELEVEQMRWKMGLSNPVAFLRRKNPDLQSDDEALAELTANVITSSAIWTLLRKANLSPDGEPGTGETPQTNGAKGGPKQLDAGDDQEDGDEAAA